MIEFNKKMAEVRGEADMAYKAAKNLQKDAATLYSKADRIWASKIVSERIRENFLKLGNVTLEPDFVNSVIDGSVESLISGDGELYC